MTTASVTDLHDALGHRLVHAQPLHHLLKLLVKLVRPHQARPLHGTRLVLLAVVLHVVVVHMVRVHHRRAHHPGVVAHGAGVHAHV